MMRRLKLRVVVSLVLVLSVTLFFMSASRSIADREKQATTHKNVGDQFSPYNPRLLNYIRSHISLPSLSRPRFHMPEKDVSQVGQSKFVDKLLSGRRNGFFIECGAADGIAVSNSLFFELERNWTGLLIEADPQFYDQLLRINRRAYVLRACVSTEQLPTTVKILQAGLLGGIADKMHPSHLQFIGDFNSIKKNEVAVNCFPLNSIAAALDVSHIDYLSLDVEGPEVEILRTVDWTRLHIDVITVEYRIYGGQKIGVDVAATLKKLKELREFFLNTGVYREAGVLPSDGGDADGLDVVFYRI